MAIKGLGNAVKKAASPAGLAEAFQFIFEQAGVNMLAQRDTYIPSQPRWKPSMLSGCERKSYYYFRGAQQDRKSGGTIKGVYALQCGSGHHLVAQKIILFADAHKMDVQMIDPDTWKLPEGTTLSNRENITADKIRKLITNPAEAEAVIQHLREQELLAPKDTEWKFYNSIYNISGLVDGALRINGVPALYEYKTINPTDFKNLTEPLSEHKEQGAVYCLTTGFDRVIFHYEDKGEHKFKSYEFICEQKHLDYMIGKMNRVNNDVANLTPSMKTTDVKKCRFCEYKTVCDRGDK